MLKKHTQLIRSYILGSHLLIVSFSWLLCYYLRFYSSLMLIHKGIPFLSQYIGFMIYLIVIWTLVFKGMRGHLIPLTNKSVFDEFCDVLKISTLSVLLLGASTFFYREHSYSRTVVLMFWAISTILITLSHSFIKTIIIKLRQKGYDVHKILIVGAGDLGKTLAEKIKNHPEMGVNIIGFLTDHNEKIGKIFDDIPVIDHIDKVKEVVHKTKPDEIFIALPLDAHERLEKVIITMGDEIVNIRVLPDLYRFMRLNGGVEDFDGLPMINISEGPLWGWNRIVKRVLDIVFSSVAIIAFSPIMILISIIIKLTSKGPVFYNQERMGLDGSSFIMYKFRSMIDDAEKDLGPIWAQKDDKRKTSLGVLIRKISLDELPQFFNVLKGDMSFIGPRPERSVFVKEFRKSIPSYMLRHKMKAGITGWAQVNGWRGNTSLEKRIEHDLFYIENWSLKFDIKIILLTVWKGFVSENAY